MTDVLLDDDGRRIFICGYATTWRTLSHPVPEFDNRRCFFLPGAFSDVLKQPLNSIKCEVNHAGPGAVIASTRDANLEIWEDDFGLAFQAGSLRTTDTAISAARSVIQGQMRGASTQDLARKQEIQIVDGEEVVAIHHVKTLVHVGPVYVPQNPYTAVWLSTENPYDMPRRIKAVAELWAASKPRHNTATALREMSRTVAARKPLAINAPAPARPSVSSLTSIGFGLSDDEWREFAFQEDVVRRALRDVEARKRVRQRERRAA